MTREEGEIESRSLVPESSPPPFTFTTIGLLQLHNLFNLKVYILNGLKCDNFSILLIPHRAVAEILSYECAL